jgi:hypothetical protein
VVDEGRGLISGAMVVSPCIHKDDQ